MTPLRQGDSRRRSACRAVVAIHNELRTGGRPRDISKGKDG